MIFTAELQVKPPPCGWFVSPFVLHSLMEGFQFCVDAFLGLITAMEGCCCRFGEALGLIALMMGCCFREVHGLRAFMKGCCSFMASFSRSLGQQSTSSVGPGPQRRH